MKLVIDTNKLFTIFWKGSLFDKLLEAGHNLYAPRFALTELRNHKQEICTRAKITTIQFEEILTDMQKVITIIPFSDYEHFVKEAILLTPNNQKDLDFVALALKLEAAILSDDGGLKDQSKIRVYNKEEFSELF